MCEGRIAELERVVQEQLQHNRELEGALRTADQAVQDLRRQVVSSMSRSPPSPSEPGAPKMRDAERESDPIVEATLPAEARTVSTQLYYILALLCEGARAGQVRLGRAWLWTVARAYGGVRAAHPYEADRLVAADPLERLRHERHHGFLGEVGAARAAVRAQHGQGHGQRRAGGHHHQPLAQHTHHEQVRPLRSPSRPPPAPPPKARPPSVPQPTARPSSAPPLKARPPSAPWPKAVLRGRSPGRQQAAQPKRKVPTHTPPGHGHSDCSNFSIGFLLGRRRFRRELDHNSRPTTPHRFQFSPGHE